MTIVLVLMSVFVHKCFSNENEIVPKYMAQAHPRVGKEERKDVCRLIDSRKLSPEACLHAAQNERLPVRAVIQVLFSEHAKHNWHADWSGPAFSGTRAGSPNLIGLETRTQSKRALTIEQLEIKRLKEDVLKLQAQCHTMQAQIERLLMSEKKKIGFFGNWRKLGIIGSVKTNTSTSFTGIGKKNDEENETGRRTPGLDTKRNETSRLVRNKTSTRSRRSSLS